MFCDVLEEDDELSSFAMSPKGWVVDCSAVFAVIAPAERERYLSEMKYVLLMKFEAVCISRLSDEELTADNLQEIFSCSGRAVNYELRL